MSNYSSKLSRDLNILMKQGSKSRVRVEAPAMKHGLDPAMVDKIGKGLRIAETLSCDVPLAAHAMKELREAHGAFAALTALNLPALLAEKDAAHDALRKMSNWYLEEQKTVLALQAKLTLAREALEKAWRDGFDSARRSVTAPIACMDLNADIEADAWADSETRAFLDQLEEKK